MQVRLFLKRFAKAVGWPVLVLLALLAGSILWTWWEPPIDPELLAVRQRLIEESRIANNAYFALVGLTARPGQDPYEVGKAWVKAAEEAYANKGAPPDWAAISDEHFTAIDDIKAPCKNPDCLSELRPSLRLLREQLNKHTVLLQRYQHILATYSHYTAPLPLSWSPEWMVGFNARTKTRSLLLGHVIVLWEDGRRKDALNELLRDLRFQKLLLEKSVSLIEQMMQVASLRNTYFVGAALLSQDVTVNAHSAAWQEFTAPLKQVDLAFERTHDGEAMFHHEWLLRTTKEDLPDPELDERDWTERWLDRAFQHRILFSPNRTINELWHLHHVRKTAVSGTAKQYVEVNHQQCVAEIARQFQGWRRLRPINAIGNYLAASGEGDCLHSYALRAYDLQAMSNWLNAALTYKLGKARDESCDVSTSDPYTERCFQMNQNGGLVWRPQVPRRDEPSEFTIVLTAH